uniref:Uncharacterized protein n=1 Tax=mine drainage metagenome TaxID=410659 RepID=E6QKS0_9ZZZZ
MVVLVARPGWWLWFEKLAMRHLAKACTLHFIEMSFSATCETPYPSLKPGRLSRRGGGGR